MSPRPQANSDAAILDAAARAIARLGILRLTLADVAAELGISPGTLLHRFGSKRGLLLALLQRSIGRVEERFTAMRAIYGSPYKTLIGLGDQMARHVKTPAALANHLAFLQVDLADKEYQRLTLTQSRAIREQIRSLIHEAIAAGELERCDADKLARAIQATMNGSLLQWAIDPQDKLPTWIRANLTTLLRPLSRRRGLLQRRP
ncbi:MAG TPA: TetR/AcrR family transcriptional regulator [Gemmatimonadaceae bacterium]